MHEPTREIAGDSQFIQLFRRISEFLVSPSLCVLYCNSIEILGTRIFAR